MNPNMLNICSDLGLIRLISMLLKHVFGNILLVWDRRQILLLILTHFKTIFYFYTPWKQKTSDFLMFQVNVKVEH